MDDYKLWGGMTAAGLLGLATQMPKIFNAFKSDRIDGTMLDRMQKQEDLIASNNSKYEKRLDEMQIKLDAQAKKMEEQSDKIHKQQVHLTKVQVFVIQLLGIIKLNNITITAEMQAEADELVKEDAPT